MKHILYVILLSIFFNFNANPKQEAQLNFNTAHYFAKNKQYQDALKHYFLAFNQQVNRKISADSLICMRRLIEHIFILAGKAYTQGQFVEAKALYKLVYNQKINKVLREAANKKLDALHTYATPQAFRPIAIDGEAEERSETPSLHISCSGHSCSTPLTIPYSSRTRRPKSVTADLHEIDIQLDEQIGGQHPFTAEHVQAADIHRSPSAPQLHIDLCPQSPRASAQVQELPELGTPEAAQALESAELSPRSQAVYLREQGKAAEIKAAQEAQAKQASGCCVVQ